MWEQLIPANWRIPYVGGWCEGYKEGAWGQATLPTLDNQTTSGVWGNAVSPVNPGETGAWDENYGNGNHPGELPPAGVDVPVYFSLGSTPAGHTAISLSDGTVASSTQAGFHATQGFIHSNLQSLIDTYAKYNNGCTYLGWSERVGKIQVVKIKGVKMTENGVRYGILGVTGGQPMSGYENEVKYWTGRDPEEYAKYLYGMSDNYMVAARKQIAQLTSQLQAVVVPAAVTPLPVVTPPVVIPEVPVVELPAVVEPPVVELPVQPSPTLTPNTQKNVWSLLWTWVILNFFTRSK